MNTHPNRFFGAASLIPLLAVGCAGSADDADGITQVAPEAIIGGSSVSASLNAQAPYSSTVLLGLGSLACSGVKIADKRFLTAGHCIARSSLSTVTISNGTSATQGSSFSIQSGTLFRHPSWELGGGNSQTGLPGLYDVAVFSIVDPQNLTGSIPAIGLSAQIATPGTNGLRLVSYGCNATSQFPGKQTALFDVVSDSNLTEFVHYIRDTGDPTICHGDSGGPLFRGTTSPKVAGVVSYDIAATPASQFTRLSNVTEWINAPAINDFSNNSTGYLMSGAFDGSFPPLRCASVMTMDPTNGADVQLDECDGASALFTGHPPGWRLLSTGSGGSFIIVNRLTGNCLGLASNTSTDVNVYTCDSVTPSNTPSRLRWTFSTPFASYSNLTNAASSRCLGVANQLRGTALRTVSCNFNDPLQKWAFSR
jgi:hypothetical protein